MDEVQTLCSNNTVETKKEVLLPMQKHPSGMTMERWNWPFKTPEERKLVMKWYKKNPTTYEAAPL